MLLKIFVPSPFPTVLLLMMALSHPAPRAQNEGADLSSASKTLTDLDAKATLYAASDKKDNPLFFYQRHKQDNGSETVYESRFVTADTKELAAREVLKLEDQVLVSYTLEHKQIGEDTQVHHRKGEIEIRHKGKSETHWRTKTLPFSSQFLVPPQILDYLKKHWSLLQKKKTLHVQLVVPHLVDRFTFKYVVKSVDPARQVAQVDFVPSNFVIRMVADPVHIEYSFAKHRALKVTGPTLLHYKGEPLIAKTVFQFK